MTATKNNGFDLNLDAIFPELYKPESIMPDLNLDLPEGVSAPNEQGSPLKLTPLPPSAPDRIKGFTAAELDLSFALDTKPKQAPPTAPKRSPASKDTKPTMTPFNLNDFKDLFAPAPDETEPVKAQAESTQPPQPPNEDTATKTVLDINLDDLNDPWSPTYLPADRKSMAKIIPALNGRSLYDFILGDLRTTLSATEQELDRRRTENSDLSRRLFRKENNALFAHRNGLEQLIEQAETKLGRKTDFNLTPVMAPTPPTPPPQQTQQTQVAPSSKSLWKDGWNTIRATASRAGETLRRYAMGASITAGAISLASAMIVGGVAQGDPLTQAFNDLHPRDMTPPPAVIIPPAAAEQSFGPILTSEAPVQTKVQTREPAKTVPAAHIATVSFKETTAPKPRKQKPAHTRADTETIHTAFVDATQDNTVAPPSATPLRADATTLKNVCQNIRSWICE